LSLRLLTCLIVLSFTAPLTPLLAEQTPEKTETPAPGAAKVPGTAQIEVPTPPVAPSETEQMDRETQEDRDENGLLKSRRIESEQSGLPKRIETYTAGKLTSVEIDENDDGLIDVWNFYDSTQRLEKEERDRNFDGQIETWTRFDPETGSIHTVFEDRDEDGEIDLWNFYEAGHVTLRGEDKENKGRATQLTLYDADGHKLREEHRSGDALFPQEQLRFDPEGQIQLRCENRDGDAVFEAEVKLKHGVVQQRRVARIHSTRVERRERYVNGVLNKVEIDNSSDGVVDVVEYYRNGQRWRSDEDTDRDGILDWSFVRGKEAELDDEDLATLPTLGSIECGKADPFWEKH